MLLTVFKQVHCFPPLDTVPTAVVDHVRAAADIGDTVQSAYDTASSLTLFRHYAAVRTLLDVKPYYGTDENAIAARAAHTASLTIDQPVDITNATIDELIARDIQLPPFSTLDRLTEQIHARARSRLFKRFIRRLTDEQKLALLRLLGRELSSRQTAYNRIKRHAKRPSRQQRRAAREALHIGSSRCSTACASVPATISSTCLYGAWAPSTNAQARSWTPFSGNSAIRSRNSSACSTV